MRVYVHVYMYVYVCACVCVYVCIYMYIHTRVGVHMHSCRCILFVCTVQSLYYMRVSQCITCVFKYLHACVGGDWKWNFFSFLHAVFFQR